MKLLFTIAFTLLMLAVTSQAAHRLPLSHRTRTMQGTLSESPKPASDHVWKFTLLGLAGVSFLIRKRL
jgi:hypothetical protein